MVLVGGKVIGNRFDKSFKLFDKFFGLRFNFSLLVYVSLLLLIFEGLISSCAKKTPAPSQVPEEKKKEIEDKKRAEKEEIVKKSRKTYF
jgi:hypothetical protein